MGDDAAAVQQQEKGGTGRAVSEATAVSGEHCVCRCQLAAVAACRGTGIMSHQCSAADFRRVSIFIFYQ